MSILFEPVRLGELQLANRIVMAPMDPQPRRCQRGANA